MSASESNGKVQDELALLFDRQMTMAPSRTDQVAPTSQPNLSYSITQHYNHSSHVASSAPAPNNRLESMEQIMQSIHDILRQNGLDPAAFSLAQLELFKNADAAQQQRLIQTWQFYNTPRSFPSQDLDMDELSGELMECHGEHAEPYMASGYEVGAGSACTLPKEPTTGKPYASSTDPVYSGQQWWEMSQTDSMESQYGLFEERNRYYSACGVAQPEGY